MQLNIEMIIYRLVQNQNHLNTKQSLLYMVTTEVGNYLSMALKYWLSGMDL